MNKKLIIWGIIIIFVLLVGWRLTHGGQDKKAADQGPKIIPVQISQASIGPIQEILVLTGDIKAETEVMVKPRTMGRVAEIYVKEGQLVGQGQPLMSYIAGIKKSDELYDDMVTTAPISGIIGIVYAKVGEQNRGADSAFALYRIDSVKIVVEIPERNYGQISPGRPLEIKVDAYPDKKFSGRITTLRPVIDPMTRTSQAEIIIPNTGRLLAPGMFATVSIPMKSKAKALILPSDAVLGEAGSNYVMVVEDQKAVKKPVTTGLVEDSKTEIVTGLTGGEQVITTGQRVVADGSAVEVIAP